MRSEWSDKLKCIRYVVRFDQIFYLSYEDLCRDPHGEMRRLSAFLGISTDHIFNVETTLKMAHQNVYDDISNAAAVRDALRGTMWEVK